MIPLFKVFLPPREELMPQLEEVLYSGQISEGRQVIEFEEGFAKWLGCGPCLSFYSGTAALHEALILAGVKPGDEVITSPMTAEPSNMAILHAGAKPVWADVEPDSGNIDPACLKELITEKTRAILVVHYGGIPVRLDSIRMIAGEAGIPVIEDAAHALGASYGKKPIGHHSEYVMFSLQAIKHITTVDGGMLVVRDAGLTPLARKVRWFGIDRHASRTEVDVDVVGYKYHMNNVNATIGLAQLSHMDFVVNRHRENGRWFDGKLSGIAGLKLCRWDEKADPSYWFYTVLAERRDDLAKALTARGVGNSMCHRRNDLHSIFQKSRRALPGLDLFYDRMLHLPCGWWLTDADREKIEAALRAGW